MSSVRKCANEFGARGSEAAALQWPVSPDDNTSSVQRAACIAIDSLTAAQRWVAVFRLCFVCARSEKEMNASLCISMDGPSTTIVNPETQEPKTFAFDFSYWSHDSFHESDGGELIPDSDKYATQRKVFDDIGQDVLNSAFDGYNSTLFAYGQTGAGKSFSMVGYGVNRGIIPMVCEEMFKAVEKSNAENNGKRYQVSVTMLEIYNEAIKDLLNLKVNKPGGLKVRTQPGRGVYVEDLTPIPVQSYKEVERKMEDGTANRTVASTKMNATSSRAHTVFGISFTCITSAGGQESSVTSNMNLVDLAGSERAESTGATGDRLKEGCAINASLSALGNVISALADIAGGKKKVFVPYRNSALTRLLQDALGGNSRTIMIAALSPADVNYDETLGTLRYADRAKKIKNNVVKMENPQDKMIRMLKEENERLLAMLGGKAMPASMDGGGDGGGGGNTEEMKAQLLAENESKLAEAMKESERQMAAMKREWEERLKAVEAEKASGANDNGSVSVKTAAGANMPYLVNLHEDPLLSECVVYMFKKGTTRIGKQGAATKQDITFSGLGILSEHATVEFDGSLSVNMRPFTGSKTFVNGDLVTAPVDLHTGDRVILGNNFVFRVINPHEPASEDIKAKMARVDTAWQDAIDEFSQKQGLRLQQSLGGEMGKLEEEEAAKRKELEEKLAAMEAEMRKEREMARIALEQQKKLLTSKDSMTDQDKQQLAALEAQYATKARNVEEEIAKRRELSEKMIQEQMKRKRQTKKIEEQLAALMPLGERGQQHGGGAGQDSALRGAPRCQGLRGAPRHRRRAVQPQDVGHHGARHQPGERKHLASTQIIRNTRTFIFASDIILTGRVRRKDEAASLILCSVCSLSPASTGRGTAPSSSLVCSLCASCTSSSRTAARRRTRRRARATTPSGTRPRPSRSARPTCTSRRCHSSWR